MQDPRIYTPMVGLRHDEAKMVGSYEGPYPDVEAGFLKLTRQLDGNLNVRLHRIEQSVNMALVPARMASAAAMVLSGFALLLAASGIYGVVAFAVTRRRREMGIRVALGAERASVLRLMVWQGFKPVLVGSIIGFALAAAAATLIRAVLYGISPFDQLAFTATAG